MTNVSSCSIVSKTHSITVLQNQFQTVWIVVTTLLTKSQSLSSGHGIHLQTWSKKVSMIVKTELTQLQTIVATCLAIWVTTVRRNMSGSRTIWQIMVGGLLDAGY